MNLESVATPRGPFSPGMNCVFRAVPLSFALAMLGFGLPLVQ